MLGDRFNLRKVLFIGTMLASITLFVFGCVSEWLGIYSKTWYVTLWIINGFAQSTGWPTVVAIMGNWFSKSGRGLIFGAWSANASVGNILGALMVAGSLKYGYQVLISKNKTNSITFDPIYSSVLVVLFNHIVCSLRGGNNPLVWSSLLTNGNW